MGLSYEKSVKLAYKVITILAVITIAEVLFALMGKGYLVEGVEFPGVLIAGVMILMSIVKAYLIVFEFMHMKYEAKGLAKTVLMPLLLLIWAVFAFFYEGSDWKQRRNLIDNKNNEKIEMQSQPKVQTKTAETH